MMSHFWPIPGQKRLIIASSQTSYTAHHARGDHLAMYTDCSTMNALGTSVALVVVSGLLACTVAMRGPDAPEFPTEIPKPSNMLAYAGSKTTAGALFATRGISRRREVNVDFRR